SQSAARAWTGTTEGDRNPSGARRNASSAYPATAHGKPAACDDRRRSRRVRGVLVERAAEKFRHFRTRELPGARFESRYARARLHIPHCVRDRAAFWFDSRVAGGEDGTHSRFERRGAQWTRKTAN